MDTIHNKQRVMQAWKTFASRDAGHIAQTFTPDAQWLAPAHNGTAVALNAPSHMIGRDAIVRFLVNDFHRLFVADVTVDIRSLFADGDTVILEERMQATLADGGRYDNDYCFVFELRDGLIHRVREYMDTHRGRQMVLGAAA